MGSNYIRWIDLKKVNSKFGLIYCFYRLANLCIVRRNLYSLVDYDRRNDVPVEIF